MLTLSIIQADTGGFVGHPAVHPAMIAEAAHAMERVRDGLLLVVAGTERDLAYFGHVTTHATGVVGHVEGNYEDAGPVDPARILLVEDDFVVVEPGELGLDEPVAVLLRY